MYDTLVELVTIIKIKMYSKSLALIINWINIIFVCYFIFIEILL